MAAVAKVKGGYRFSGELQVPGDKSITHRAMILTFLAGGETKLVNFSPAQDCLRTLSALGQMGLKYSMEEDYMLLKGPGREWTHNEYLIDAGNSGTTARLFMGLAGFLSPRGSLTITGDKSLTSRPMERVAKYLRPMGLEITYLEQEGRLPLKIRRPGKLLAQSVVIEEPSAQVKSAVLLAGLAALGETKICQNSTRNHTELMLRAMGCDIETYQDWIHLKGKDFKVPGVIEIPGDISSAAWFLALGAIAGNVTLKNVGLNPTRTGFMEILQSMGAKISYESKGYLIGEPVGDLEIEKSPLQGTVISQDMIPKTIDELPALAVVASFAQGRTIVSGAKELIYKESNRLRGIGQLLLAFGGNVEITGDGFSILGPQVLRPGVFNSSDHRLVMAGLILASLVKGESEIGDTNWLNVSYPNFLKDLTTICQDQGQLV